MKTEFVRYLERLSELYPTIDKASTEIINLQSILNLPKGTEHFLSDIHGEYESFSGIHSVQMTRVSLHHLFTIQKKK